MAGSMPLPFDSLSLVSGSKTSGALRCRENVWLAWLALNLSSAAATEPEPLIHHALQLGKVCTFLILDPL